MTTAHQIDKMRDSWLDPGDEFDEENWCPLCHDESRDEPGIIEGDKWEWWCSREDCNYHGDNFGDI